MIAVIADDFTGAAEIGGLGLKYDLRIEISTGVNPGTKADLLIIAMDTRSQSEKQAALQIKEIIRQLLPLKPALIFKKVDSVLRGHVLPEIKAQLEVSGLKKALLIPANPSLGRTLVNGHYFLNGNPVHLSSFAHDPEFPVHSSKVEHMLRAKEDLIHILPHTSPLPEEGVTIGEVSDVNDLKAWCHQTNNNMVIAGASGFFDAMLKYMNVPALAPAGSPTQPPSIQTSVITPFGQPALLVCGSTVTESRSFVRTLQQQGAPVSFVPTELVLSEEHNPSDYQSCVQEVVANLVKHHKAIIAVHPDLNNQAINPAELRIKMGSMVKYITGYTHLQELLIEGGSTAAAILQQLDIHTMYPVDQLAPGVIRMRVKGNNDLHLTLKPGSYAWPPNIL